MLADWVGMVRRWIARGDDRRRRSPRAAAVAATPAQRPRQPHPFEEAVRRLRERPDGGAGRLRLISLAEFHRSVADKWPRLVDKVAVLADNVIRLHLGRGSLYRQQCEDCWLLLFPDEDPEDARRRTVEIADDISRRLLGERCVGNARPLAQAGHLMAAEALADGGIDAAAIDRALAQSRAFLDDAAPPAAAPQWREILPRRPAPVADWRPLRFSHGEDAAFDRAPPLPPDARLSLLWRPTWVAENEAISAYCARLLRIDRAAEAPREGAQAYPPDDVATAIRLDMFAAAAAVRGLRHALAAGQAPSIIVPLSWDSVMSAERRRLASPFADLSAEMRRERVKIELFHVPDDVSARAIAEAVGFLGSVGGEVLVRLRLSSPLPSRADSNGIARMGLDLSELRADERMDDERLLGILDGLHGAARDVGVDCYLWGARRRRVVGEVVLGGFGMVNGPGLMKDVGRPAVILPAPLRHFAA